MGIAKLPRWLILSLSIKCIASLDHLTPRRVRERFPNALRLTSDQTPICINGSWRWIDFCGNGLDSQIPTLSALKELFL
jgi:hypothetical protein